MEYAIPTAVFSTLPAKRCSEQRTGWVSVELSSPIILIAVEICCGITGTSAKQPTFSITFTSPHFVSLTMVHPCLLSCHISKIQSTGEDTNKSSGAQCKGRLMKVRGYAMVTGYKVNNTGNMPYCGYNS